MGIIITEVRLPVVVLAALCLVPLCAASHCLPGQQYWSNESESCVNCSRCDAGARQVVMRPCLAHADTICGPISALDWSWLRRPNDKHKHVNKHHDKLQSESSEEDTLFGEKKHTKKGHNHHGSLDDDIEMKPFHHSILDDEVEKLPEVHHGSHKHHKHNQPKIIDEDGIDFKKKVNKEHHTNPDSETLFSDDVEPFYDHIHKLPPPPPIKSTDDLEKEWKEWLVQSKNRLQHRKDDLLKTLHNENGEKHHGSHRMNHPSGNVFDDFDGEIFPHSVHHKDHLKKHYSPLDVALFERLLNHEHQKHKERESLSHLFGEETKHGNLLDMLKSEDKKHDKFRNGDDLGYPMDSFDFRSVVPTRRLFLGEPSTVSEIMDQDLSEESEDDEDERVKEDPTVVAVPFTLTERFIWDWQALALASAVAACLLFFTVVTVYSILHARQWRRLKTNFDNEAEELSVKMGLMAGASDGGVGASAADAANTNLYLEKLLESNKKKSSNIYTQKRPLS